MSKKNVMGIYHSTNIQYLLVMLFLIFKLLLIESLYDYCDTKYSFDD